MLGVLGLMILVGFINGFWSGIDRARAMENLSTSTPPPAWIKVAALITVVIFVVKFLVETPRGEEVRAILDVGSMGLAYLVSYVISAAVAFLITRRLAKKRSSA
jgi:prolipoprotein diacylglyceryltransferase